MDNTLVSVRVSRAKKERGSGVFASIGATTSDLINSAFDYAIATKGLLSVQKTNAPDARAFAAFVSESTLEVAWPEGFDVDYKQLSASLRADARRLATPTTAREPRRAPSKSGRRL